MLEAVERLMARVVPPALSQFYLDLHACHGVDVVLGASVSKLVSKLVSELVSARVGRIAAVKTADPAIVAADDCTVRRLDDGSLRRLESVQNAMEQARSAVVALLGRERPFTAAPWFWSDQYDVKLEMAGMTAGFDLGALLA